MLATFTVASSRNEWEMGKGGKRDTVKSFIGDVDGFLISGNNVIHMHTLGINVAKDSLRA